MKLTLIRKEFTDNSTIGDLLIDGDFFCYVLEDKDRWLKDTDSLIYIKANKIFGVTAIPYGTYKVELSFSPHFKRILPAILNVKGFTGIRIHRGNTAKDSLGCLIVGYKKNYDTVFESKRAEEALIRVLNMAEEITIEILKEKI